MDRKIYIKEFINGDTAVSYDDGVKCQKEMLSVIDATDNIILDFEGVEYAITAFLNPVIGDMILQFGSQIMRKIGIANANTMIIKKIKLVRDGALLKREDLEE